MPPPSPKYYEKKHYSGQNRTWIKSKSNKSIVLFTNYTFSSSYLWLLLYYTVVTDLIVSSIQKIEQFYYGKTMVHFCKGCDVHVLKIEAFKNERLSVYLY